MSLYIYSPKYIYKNVHSSAIYSSQTLEHSRMGIYSRDYIAMRMNKDSHVTTWISLMIIRLSEKKPDINEYILFDAI